MRIQILILRFKGLKNWLRQERIKTPNKVLKVAPFCGNLKVITPGQFTEENKEKCFLNSLNDRSFTKEARFNSLQEKCHNP